MRILPLLTVIGALAGAGALQAQVEIRVTGSTAFRANAYRSITNLYGANLTAQNPAGNASSSNRVTWSGTIPSLFGGQTVTVRASYSGSVAGIQSLAQNLNLTFLSSSTPGDTTTLSAQADLAFSDVFQNSTIYTSPALADKYVGVVPFAYVRSAQTTLSVTNISIQQIQSFFSNGYMPLSYFTGNANDDNSLIYLVGRDSGSGTRLTAERDGLFVGAPLLWAPDVSCNWNISSGFTSGSGIAGVLNGSCGPAIGYLGLPDANNVNAGGNIISYNGFRPYLGTSSSPDWSPIRKGLYSFWGYQHLFKRSTSNANVTSFWNALGTEIDLDLASSTTAIQVSTMQVIRNADGGPISP